MVAYSLVNMVGRASAANILGITVRELDKLVEIYDLSEKLTNLVEPGASITWAREVKNLNKKLLTPTILDNIVRKINEQEITNSKDIRKLRQVLKDPVAKENFAAPGAASKARCPGWESNPSRGLILRKLLILRNNKMEKNHKNAEVRYTAGTRNNRRASAERHR